MDKWKMYIRNSTNGHLKVSGWVGFFCLFVLFFLFLPENSKHFVSAETFQLNCDQ